MPDQRKSDTDRKPLGRALSDADAADIYGWLAIPRAAAVLLSLVAVSSLWVGGRIGFDPRPVLYVVIPVFLALSAMTWVAMRRRIRPRATLYTQIFFDYLAITLGLALTGGAKSPFVPMYVLVVISAGAVSADAAIIVGALAIAALIGLAALDHQGVLHAMSGFPAISANEVVSIAILAAIIAIVTFQSQFYVTRIRAKDEELLKLKDEFLFRTIHDLRSPTTIIRLVFDKYNLPAYRDALPDFKKDAGYIETSLGRMTTLIEDLLKIGRGEQVGFKMKQDRVELAALIRGVAEELTPAMAKKRVTFRYAPAGEVAVIGDIEKLKETFNNFIENATKYGKEGGMITVTHRVRKGKVETEVADDGIGISEASLAKLFTPYYRGDIGNEIPGTGLGMYMTKKLVERMGGTVAVRSEKGKGTAFTVTLPAT